ncbi:MAG: TIGR00730 family Rossman fold protein [Bacteroidales bacterium]|nr:TIGR00730 family Rossman fold protein [Bacteroidales bacterium]
MNISVFCGSSSPKNEAYAAAARELGRRIAEGGHTLLYGGSNLGLMGEVSGAALAGDGRVVGVIPTLFSEAVIRSQPVTELVRVSTMAERKEYLIAHSDAFVALPGGIGTLDEVSEVMVANQLQHLGKPMVLLNLDGFYDPFLVQLRVMHDAGFVRKGAETALHTVASVDELFRFLAADAAEIS